MPIQTYIYAKDKWIVNETVGHRDMQLQTQIVTHQSYGIWYANSTKLAHILTIYNNNKN